MFQAATPCIVFSFSLFVCRPQVIAEIFPFKLGLSDAAVKKLIEMVLDASNKLNTNPCWVGGTTLQSEEKDDKDHGD